jgi:hypothetical protein
MYSTANAVPSGPVMPHSDEIEKRMEHLARSFSEAEGKLATIRERLGFVLNPATPEARLIAGKDDPKMQSRFFDHMDGTISRVKILIDIADDILNRLAL